ncbi:hypothetical protein NW767_014730 [Fusarium falciforme]|nr:hypothetical protein NW767_014730 [Fusarium falciforme]
MFGLELQDLAPLWKIYMDFKGFFVRTKMSDEHKPFSQMGMNMEDANEAASKYRDFCSREDFNEYRREIYNNRQKSTVRRWMFGLSEDQKPNDEGTFGRDEDSDDEMLVARRQRDSQIDKMLDFESFWEDSGTWERLHALKTVLQHPERYDIQKINELCRSWLRHYEKSESVIRELGSRTDQEMTPGTQLLEELKVWETATEQLSEALQWAEGFFWPKEPLSVRFWGDDEDSNLTHPVSEQEKASIVNNDNEDGEASGSPHDKKIMPDWVIKENFSAALLRWNEVETSGGVWKPDEYVLEPWSGGWFEAIWSIPHLFAAKDQVNLEELFQLEERCVKRGAWRGAKMEIFQAETITLV